MLPLSSSRPSSPELHIRRPKTPPDDEALDRKNSFNSLNSLLVHQSRTWLFLSVLLLQILLLIAFRSAPVYLSSSPHHSTAATSSPIAAVYSVAPELEEEDQCGSGRVFVYEIPTRFNGEIVKNCDELNPWSSRCAALANDGFGEQAVGISQIVPDNLAPA